MNDLPPNPEQDEKTEESTAGAVDGTAFADHERTGRHGGTFRSPNHHLDRVNLHAPPTERKGGGFGAPRLDDAALHRKISVCNEVLTAFANLENSAANDWIQQTIDSAAPQFAALFVGVRLQPNGSLDCPTLVANVRQRPPTEHRRLINAALLDLMDRVVSRSETELSEEAVEALLISVSGYRKRLGL